MSRTFELQGGIKVLGSYFFLSYAHSPPLAGTKQADPDQWVRRFYQNLTESVARHAKEPQLAAGFFDQQISLSAGWKASIKQALGLAQTFVPLLSPGYYSRSWPAKEWASFSQRLAEAGLSEAERDRRVIPVLWVAMPTEPERPGLQKALTLDTGDPAYAENGLRAMLRLPPYQESYRRIVDQLAQRIVSLVESEPVQPSAAPSFDYVASPAPFQSAPGLGGFTVYVAAPTLSELPVGPDPRGYGAHGADWRAYPDDQELPLAEYTVQVAEQLDLSVSVAEIGPSPAAFTQPGVLLIDPWFIAIQRGAELIRLAKDLPSWVVPILALEPRADARATDHTRKIGAILGRSAARSDAVSHAIKGVSSLRDFVALMPILVTEAARQYARHGAVARPVVRRSSPPRLTANPPSPQLEDRDDAGQSQ
jgi:FxsC-like protein